MSAIEQLLADAMIAEELTLCNCRNMVESEYDNLSSVLDGLPRESNESTKITTESDTEEDIYWMLQRSFDGYDYMILCYGNPDGPAMPMMSIKKKSEIMCDNMVSSTITIAVGGSTMTITESTPPG